MEEDIPIRLWDDIRLGDDSLASQFFFIFYFLSALLHLNFKGLNRRGVLTNTISLEDTGGMMV